MLVPTEGLPSRVLTTEPEIASLEQPLETDGQDFLSPHHNGLSQIRVPAQSESFA
jgi:hypothetical protein